MNKDMFVKIGKDKVKNGYMKSHFNELHDKVFEIVGATKADYYGTTTIEDMKNRLDNENGIYCLKFYKYVDFELEECSFVGALSTLEYEENNIFIFSEAPEDERMYYVAQVINN